jgi:hypothetical protein
MTGTLSSAKATGLKPTTAADITIKPMAGDFIIPSLD